MTTKISKSDFSFRKVSYGRYKVTYTSPVTYKKWSCETTDMELIGFTLEEDNPKIKDLEILKGKCKRGQKL